MKVRSELENIRQQSAQRRVLQSSDQAGKIEALEQKNTRLRGLQAACSLKLAKLKRAYQVLEKKNRRASRQLDKLETDIEKREGVIYLQQRVIRTLDDSRRTIEKSLEKKISAQGIHLEDMQDRLREVLFEKIYFAAGSATLSDSAKTLLRKFAESVRHDSGVRIEVRGYSDNSPIGPGLKSRFASNWELSAARALAVIHFLQNQGHLNPERMVASALVEGPLPSAGQETGTTRRKSRRVEVIIHPLNHLAEPLAPPKKKEKKP